jgi:hypothetical protein
MDSAKRESCLGRLREGSQVFGEVRFLAEFILSEPRFFVEFILSEPRFFALLRMTGEGLRMTSEGLRMTKLDAILTFSVPG